MPGDEDAVDGPGDPQQPCRQFGLDFTHGVLRNSCVAASRAARSRDISLVSDPRHHHSVTQHGSHRIAPSLRTEAPMFRFCDERDQDAYAMTARQRRPRISDDKQRGMSCGFCFRDAPIRDPHAYPAQECSCVVVRHVPGELNGDDLWMCFFIHERSNFLPP